MLRALAGLFGDDDRRLSRVLITAMAVGFLALIGVGLSAVSVTREDRSHASWVQHTYEVQVALGRVELFLERSEATRRGYLLTGLPTYLTHALDYQRELGRWVDRVARLTHDNPRQQANIAALRVSLAAVAQQRARSFSLIAAGDRDGAIAAFTGETTARRMLGVRAQLARMNEEERQLLVGRDRSLQETQRSFNVVLIAAGVLLALLAFVSLIVILRFAHDLTRSRDRLALLNDTLEEQVAERTADLSRANEEIQRFAYIVSHDLRSPLVNVMGFTAELHTATAALGALVDRVETEAPALLDGEAKAAAREDLPEAIGFIRSSTQKMDRLINAILKLSREGRRVIVAEPIDVAAVAEGAVDAIRHIVDERGVEVSVERPVPALVSDRLAIEQILSNLIENATKYLQPGRPGHITVSARAGAGRVIVAVADNGRGIDPRDHQRIFDLFRRSGAQDQPGEGIGLAHVRALAYRLGGTIDVQSTLGEGATFRLNLPATYQPPQDSKT